jgi:histidinol-phosphate/aromatic aminotransferase/cobyric acid decarboxylase-like protein/GNAT superfamily N-acetyltransferase
LFFVVDFPRTEFHGGGHSFFDYPGTDCGILGLPVMIENAVLSKVPAQNRRVGEKISISIASEPELEEIYRVRHEVYARELGQHPTNAELRLRDALDGENIYLVAGVAGQMAGFISVTPPGQGRYSIDKYFSRESLPFEVDESLYEVRLVTVLPEYRGSDVAVLLMYAAFRWVESHGGQQLVAIGRREILDLYVKLGLKPAGKFTRCGQVTYDLLHATVPEMRAGLQQFRSVLTRFEAKADWRLNFTFQKPAACFHGGAFFKAIGEGFATLERREGIINADVLDAWFPPSPRIMAGLRADDLEWLLRTSPPTGCEGLVEHIAKARGVKPLNILPGGGSSDLIFRALPYWLSKSSHVLILDPTYGEYAHVLEKVIGAMVDRLKLVRQNNYDVDLGGLERALRDNYDLVVLVNPNSPTGRHIPRELLQAVLRGAPERTRIWVDETYIDYVSPDESMEQFAAQSENVIVCKSLSKAYALSGARVAYLCAGAHQLETLRALTPPWVVGLPAQLAASVALNDSGYYETRYAETHRLREQLAEHLQTLGWEVTPGTANFLLCHLPESGPSAEQLIQECQRQGLFLRNASSMGSQLGSHAIRIAVKDTATNARILRIIKEAQVRLAALA